MRIGLYGKLAEVAGKEIDLAIPANCPVAEVRQRLSKAYPALADMFAGKVSALVDDCVVPDTHIVQPDTRVEFFPPVSGG